MSLHPAETINEPPRFPVVDGHVDLVYDLMRRHSGIPFEQVANGQVTASSLARGGVRVLVAALYCADSHNGPASAAREMRRLYDYARRHLGWFSPLRRPGEMAATLGGSGPPGIIFLVENADALLELGLDEARRWGVRAVGLTHAGRNRLADGNGVTDPKGLTAAGKSLLRNIAGSGLILDVAHLAEPGFRDVASLFTGPLISSHTGLRSFCDRPRNLSDPQVAEIARRGGMVGIAAAPEMLVPEGTATLDDLFRQVDFVVQRHGPEAVGIGSDFGGFDGTAKGAEDHGGLPLLAERLLGAGYPAGAVGLIMGGNWFRIYGGASGKSGGAEAGILSVIEEREEFLQELHNRDLTRATPEGTLGGDPADNQ
ncbi:dipeptidase [Geobacter hydrogenophilus]|uniref:Peptidase n=1 Tax=Geobacter hydrogenophilus TaxID=40983 RepID=A0A9W6LBG6_9BACT|nr:dipeptidase [Geobacter hydrogenophilus]GLI37963.1 peptidase [Geobacter hydrogenophilus]